MLKLEKYYESVKKIIINNTTVSCLNNITESFFSVPLVSMRDEQDEDLFFSVC